MLETTTPSWPESLRQRRSRLAWRVVPLLGLLALTPLAIATPPTGSGVHFRVAEPVGVARTGDVVRVGVPLARGRYPGAERNSSLPLQVEGIPISQNRVLQLWPDGSARWTLLKFPIELAAREQRRFEIVEAAASPAPAIAEATETDIRINTGPLEFTVSRGTRFRLLDSIECKGQRVTGVPTDTGITLTDSHGTTFHGMADRVVLQENGPVQATVEVEGRFFDAAGKALLPRASQSEDRSAIRFSLWLTATRGRSDLKLLFNLANPGSKDLQAFEGRPAQFGSKQFSNQDTLKQWLYFQDLRLRVPLEVELATDVRTAEQAVESGADEEVLLQQWYLPAEAIQGTNAPAGFRTTLTHNHRMALSNRARSDGWMSLQGSGGRVIAAFEYFWQNWPKSLGFRERQLEFGVFPDLPANALAQWTYAAAKDVYHVQSWTDGTKANEPENFQVKDRSQHVFQGGRWKAHRMWLQFAANQDSDPAQDVRAFRHPLVGVIDGDYLVSTGTWPEFFPGTLRTEDAMVNAALTGRRRWRTALLANRPASFPSKTSIPASRDDTTQRGWANLYGYPNFGDLSWGGGKGRYCNLHYDWPFGMLLDFLRYGDDEFFRLGDQMARYRREWGQYHHRGGMVWADGLSWYEQSDHGFEPERPRRTHNWNGGLLLHYLLTGEELSRRAVIENADGCHDSFYWGYRLGGKLDQTAIQTSTREQGWAILAMLHGYQLTGDSKYLEQCKRVIRQITLPTLQEVGGMRQFVKKHGSLMFGYCSSGFLKLYDALPKDDPLRKDMADLFVQIVDGVENPEIKTEAQLQQGRFTPPKYKDPWGKPSTTYSLFFTDPLAFLVKEVSPHPALSRRLKENLYTAFVHQSSPEPTRIQSPETWPTPGFRTVTGGQITKELGWMGLLGNYALATFCEVESPPDFRRRD